MVNLVLYSEHSPTGTTGCRGIPKGTVSDERQRAAHPASGPRAREGRPSEQSARDFTRGGSVAYAREKRSAAELALDRSRAGPRTEHLPLRAQGFGGRGVRLRRSRHEAVFAGGGGA